MANGDGQSKAPYIIICAGETQVRVAKDPDQKVAAASQAAANLVSYYGDKLTAEDTKPISRLQHTMMEAVPNCRPDEAELLCGEMFDLLDALEESQEAKH